MLCYYWLRSFFSQLSFSFTTSLVSVSLIGMDHICGGDHSCKDAAYVDSFYREKKSLKYHCPQRHTKRAQNKHTPKADTNSKTVFLRNSANRVKRIKSGAACAMAIFVRRKDTWKHVSFANRIYAKTQVKGFP